MFELFLVMLVVTILCFVGRGIARANDGYYGSVHHMRGGLDAFSGQGYNQRKKDFFAAKATLQRARGQLAFDHKERVVGGMDSSQSEEIFYEEWNNVKSVVDATMGHNTANYAERSLGYR